MADTLTAAPAAPATGPLTIEQAAKEVSAERKARNKVAAPPEPEETDPPVPGSTTERVDEYVERVEEFLEDSEAAPQAADDGEGAPETDTPDAGEAQDNDPDPGPKLDPPARWEAEDKALFATLPRKAQETILAREKLQQAEVTKAQQKSADVAKTFETRLQHLNAVAETIGQYVDTGTAKMQYWQDRMSKWDDWFASEEAAQMAQEDEPSYRANVALHRKEIAKANQDGRTLEKAKADKAKAEAAEFAAYTQEQGRLMSELIPELADEKEGPKLRSDLIEYLKKDGFEAPLLKRISAKEARIAFKAKKHDDLEAKYADTGGLAALVRDAELYRKSVKAVKNPPAPKQPKAGPSSPAAGQGQTPSSSEARLKQLSAKKNPSMAEMAELMKLERKLGK